MRSITEIETALDAVGEALEGFDPRLLAGDQAADLAARLARAVKVCDAARVRSAARAVECGAHRDAGLATPHEWAARQAGTSVGRAKGELELAVALDEHEATREAVAAGDVSLEQAADVVRTAQVDPDAEAEMLAAAKRSTMRQLKDKGRLIRARTERPDERHARLHAMRSFTSGVDEEGMQWLTARGAPGTLTHLINAVQRQSGREFRAARSEGRRERAEAYAFDAFLKVANGEAEGGRPDWSVNVLVDWPALARGFAEKGERCKIPGVGDVPVAFVRDLLERKRAFLKAVLYDGVEITKVMHFGRHPSAHVLTSLMLGPPPDFDGPKCLRCGNRYQIEWDHRRPYTAGGPTNTRNIDGLCDPCHVKKTAEDRAAGLLNPVLRERELAGVAAGGRHGEAGDEPLALELLALPPP